MTLDLLDKLLILAIAWFVLGGQLPSFVSAKATAATYVYEKDQGSVPPPVLAGLNRLNRERGIVATTFEDDTTDGTGAVPDQYQTSLEAAQKAGLPALVVVGGNKVLRVIKDPRTEEQVLEAVP